MTHATLRGANLQLSLESGHWMTARMRLSPAPATAALRWGAERPGNVRCARQEDGSLVAQCELPWPWEVRAREACQARLQAWLTQKSASRPMHVSGPNWEEVLLDGPWSATITDGVGTVPAARVGDLPLVVRPLEHDLHLSAEICEAASLDDRCRRAIATYVCSAQAHARMVRGMIDTHVRIEARLELDWLESELMTVVDQLQMTVRQWQPALQALCDTDVARAYLDSVISAGR